MGPRTGGLTGPADAVSLGAMPEGDAPIPNRLSPLHPVRSVRILLRSPAYRLAAGWGALVISLVIAAPLVYVWMTTASQVASLHMVESLEVINRGGAGLSVLVVARGVCTWILWAGALVCGLQAFTPERRAGTMEQLLLLPLPRVELVLARMLRALLPLVPALLSMVAVDCWVILVEAAAPGRPLLLSMAAVFWIFAGALLVIALGTFISLRVGWAARSKAVMQVLAGVTVELLVIWFYLVVGLAPIWPFLIFGVAKTAFALAATFHLIGHFDALALGEEARAG